MIGMFSGLTLTYTFGENHVTVQTKKMNLLENIDKNNLPHLAIIMDGNGRWAKQQGYQSFGHESGTKSVKIIIKPC
jgi:undecaprenyl diphosphate synthase